MMLAGQTILFLLILLLLTTLTKQAKKDCVKGKTYWSEESFIPSENGLCIACPPDWQTCNDQPVGNGNRQRCVDSCWAKPKSSSSSNVPLTPITSFIPPEVIPSPPTSMAYTLHVRHPVDVKRQEKERSDGTEELEKNTGLIIAVSAFAILLGIACTVAVLLLIRKIRSRSSRARSRDRINEEGINLQEIPARNYEEDRLIEQNVGEQDIQEQRHEEERHDDEVLPACDTENHLVAVQETQPPGPVQATPSERNVCGIQDKEEGKCQSCFHLNEVDS